MPARILAAVDPALDRSAVEVLDYAREIARPSTSIGVASVLSTLRDSVTDPWSVAGLRERIDRARCALESMLDRVGLRAEMVSVETGNAAAGILAAAEQFDADLIILGAPRHELLSYLIGDTRSAVARRARCAVLLLPPRMRVERERPATTATTAMTSL